MAQKKYVKNCSVCKKMMRVSNPHQRTHIKCKKPKRVRKHYFSKQALEVRGRDKHKCQHCGAYLGGSIQRYDGHVHHIDENTGNNDLNNLILLCVPCHRKVHKSSERKS